MNKKNHKKNMVCDQLSMSKIATRGFLALALMSSVSYGSYAQAAGFTALGDPKTEVETYQDNPTRIQPTPVVIAGAAAIVAAVKSSEIAQVAQQIAQIRNTVKGFTDSIRTSLGIEARHAERDKILNDESINAKMAAASAQIGAMAAHEDAAHAMAMQRLTAEVEQDIQNQFAGDLVGICIAQTQKSVSNQGGAINEEAFSVRGGRAQSRIAFITGSGGGGQGGGTGGGEGEKPPQPNAKNVEDVAAAAINEEIAGGSNSDLGAPGAAGPLAWYNSIAQAVLGPYEGDGLPDLTGKPRYITENAWLGAGEQLGGAVQNPLSGMDLLSGQFTRNSPFNMTFPCTSESADGKFILSSMMMAFCDQEKTNWETHGANLPDKPLDLASAFLIRDYMLPAPFTPFKIDFLERVKGNEAGEGDLAARELFAKTRRLLASKNLLASVYNAQIASRLQQKVDKEGLAAFKSNWEKVYPGVQAPDFPSARARRDVEVEAYRSSEFMKNMVSAWDVPTHISGQTAIMGEMVGLQKDTLYALERIELLLATMLSNDLEDRRDALERRIPK